MKKIVQLLIIAALATSCRNLLETTCSESNRIIFKNAVGKWDIRYYPSNGVLEIPPVFSSAGPNTIIMRKDGRIFEPFYFSNGSDTALADTGRFEVVDCGHALLFRTNLSKLTNPDGLKFVIQSLCPDSIVTNTSLPIGENSTLVPTKVVLSNKRPVE